MNNTDPDKETLRQALDIEWQDHFQTRRQTWRALEITAILLLGLVVADLRLDNTWVTVVLGILVVLASLVGVSVSVHHRRAQIRKFAHIDRLEEALGLHRTGLLDDVHPPAPFKWTDVLDLRRMNTPLFILRMQIAIVLFVVVYLTARLLSA